MNRYPRNGSSHTPILVFAGIVGLSVLFFFIFSAGSFGKKESPAAPAPAPVARTPVVPAKLPADAAVSVPLPGETPAGVPRVTASSTLEGLLAELAGLLAAGDFDAVEKFTVTSDNMAPRTAFLKQLLLNCGWLVASKPWVDAGTITGVNRRELKLEPADPGVAKPAGAVMADFERVAGSGWRVKAWRFDAALVTQAEALLAARAITVSASGLTDAPDPLDQARKFLKNVVGHDFKAARSITEASGVTHEKLAGLCIVFEEGEYRIADTRPVVVTAGTADSAWAIVKVRSDKQNLDSEVGITLQRTPAGEWRVQALDFNKMLESYVQATGGGSVFYSPLVKSAKGGESIVLYFEFDKAELHPRALHQLDIISSLLKSDPARKMRITGHTDALGADDYNARLSATRAKNVHARLLELGVSATQIETSGVGSKIPLELDKRPDGSDNPDGRSRNRRTEIYLDF